MTGLFLYESTLDGLAHVLQREPHVGRKLADGDGG
jgi:hypothetical protein